VLRSRCSSRPGLACRVDGGPAGHDSLLASGSVRTVLATTDSPGSERCSAHGGRFRAGTEQPVLLLAGLLQGLPTKGLPGGCVNQALLLPTVLMVY
jgi:hypothetical protein